MGYYNLQLVCMFCLCVIVVKGHHDTVAPPKIGISSWITAGGTREEQFEWKNGNIAPLIVSGALRIKQDGENTTLILSSFVDKLRIVCNATYPVAWTVPESDFHLDDEYSYYSIHETRYARNVRKPETFLYQSTLEITESSGTASRNYVCGSLGGEGIQRNVYVFWEGTNFLTYAGETLDVRTKDNKTVVLPCTVTKPDATVYLVKETGKGLEELWVNSSIMYDPRAGYILQIKDLSDPYGRYRCVSEDESEEDEERSVRVNVLHGLQGPEPTEIEFNETMIGKASFRFDKKASKFICCSNSAKPPNLKVIYCQDRPGCRAREKYLYKISGVNKWSREGNCTSHEVYKRNSGILRCKGDGIDIFKFYITTISEPKDENETFSLYYSIEKIPKEDLMNLILTTLDQHLYHGQNFTAFCDVSPFYFSNGIKWAVSWKNRSLQFLEESQNPFPQEIRHGRNDDFNNVLLTAHIDMESLICYGPVWNSTKWVQSELELKVKMAYSPTVIVGNSKVQYWNLNDTGKELFCEVLGDPVPYIQWKKDNKTIIRSESNLDFSVNYENGTSSLNISRVSHSSQGEYICSGYNFMGEDHGTIWVYVLEPTPHNSNGMMILISTLFCLTLLGGIGFLVWKLKWQGKIIDHLTRVVFRDVA